MKKSSFVSSQIGALAIMFAASLWAIDGLFLRPSLYKFDVFIIVFLEHLIAFLIMTILFFPKLKEVLRVKHKQWLMLSIIALFGGTIGTIAITKAFFMAFAGKGSLATVLLLQKLQPLFAIILAIIVLKEKPSKRFYFWTGLAIIGSYILTFGFNEPNLTIQDTTSKIALLAIIAAFSFASGTVFGRSAVRELSFEITTYLRFGLTALISGILILILGKISSIGSIDFAAYKTLLIIAFTTGGSAIFIYYYGLKRVRASSATLYELAFPIVAIVGDWIINGQFFGFPKLFGGALLVFSITALVLDKRKYDK